MKLQNIMHITLPSVLTLTAIGCGVIVREDTKKYDASHNGMISKIESGEVRSNPNLSSDSNAIIPIKCKVPKTDIAFANSVYQNLFRRSLTDTEIKELSVSGLDREKYVDKALSDGEATNGITVFLNNLFKLDKIVPRDLGDAENEAIAAESRLVADLQKEPIELILRNLDKPWSYFFTTRNIYCTKSTASLYQVAGIESGSFMSCTLPQNRAGILGLASVLRANPSTMAGPNNNYHRVAFSVYLSTGVVLFEATDGPIGEEGIGMPLPACVPSTDVRRNATGGAYGTASVPSVGPICASCHSRYNGPLSVAFRNFNEFGETYRLEDFDNQTLFPDALLTTLGTSRAELKVLVNETNSCWSKDGVAPARTFDGVAGYGRLITESGLLGQALGVQIPEAMGNQVSDPNMSSTIRKYFNENGETLSAALKGYLISDSFQCQVKEEG